MKGRRGLSGTGIRAGVSGYGGETSGVPLLRCPLGLSGFPGGVASGPGTCEATVSSRLIHAPEPIEAEAPGSTRDEKTGKPDVVRRFLLRG